MYKDNEDLKNQLSFNFLSNNVKGLQSAEKQLKLFNFLKNNIGPKGILVLWETHCSIDILRNFNAKIYFSHGKTGILIAIYDNLNISGKHEINASNDCLLANILMSVLKRNN